MSCTGDPLPLERLAQGPQAVETAGPDGSFGNGQQRSDLGYRPLPVIQLLDDDAMLGAERIQRRRDDPRVESAVQPVIGRGHRDLVKRHLRGPGAAATVVAGNGQVPGHGVQP